MNQAAAIIKYSKLISRALDGREILLATEFDISSDGKYISGVFALSDEKLCVIQNGETVLIENISDFSKVCCGEYTGGGILEAFGTDHKNEIISVLEKNGYKPRFVKTRS